VDFTIGEADAIERHLDAAQNAQNVQRRHRPGDEEDHARPERIAHHIGKQADHHPGREEVHARHRQRHAQARVVARFHRQPQKDQPQDRHQDAAEDFGKARHPIARQSADEKSFQEAIDVGRGPGGSDAGGRDGEHLEQKIRRLHARHERLQEAGPCLRPEREIEEAIHEVRYATTRPFARTATRIPYPRPSLVP
jgi:hypothetical protein